MNRMIWLTILVILPLLAGRASAVPFRFVALPDTQIYSENILPGTPNRPPVTDPLGTGHIFGDQTQWIVENAAAMNIRYVGHLGDIIQNGEIPSLADQEWALAKQAMDKLHDADIPYGTVMGNHDDDGSHGPTYNADYLNYFGPQNFVGKSWYTDSSPSGGGNFQLLEHGGQKIGFINFSIDQPQDEIDWANNIISSNRDTLFIVGTHRYQYDYKLFAGRYNEVNITPLGTFQITEGQIPDNGTYGQELFDQLVATNHNVMMIHSGHFHSEWLRVTPRDEMETVIEMLTDYQDARNGGDGWMRLYSMDLENNTFSWDTYSPTAEVPDGTGGTQIGGYRSTLHHFAETIQQAYVQRGQVMAVLGLIDENSSELEVAVAEQVYLAMLTSPAGTVVVPADVSPTGEDILAFGLKDTAAPDNFLEMHPDWDETYFNSYLADMFDVPNGGTIPPGFSDLREWEGLWFAAFASDQGPSDPFGFAPGFRSPSGSLSVTYGNFVVPEPASLLLLASSLSILVVRRVAS